MNFIIAISNRNIEGTKASINSINFEFCFILWRWLKEVYRQRWDYLSPSYNLRQCMSLYIKKIYRIYEKQGINEIIISHYFHIQMQMRK